MRGRFDDHFQKFKDLMRNKIDIEHLVNQTLQKNQGAAPLTKSRARTSFFETFKEEYLPPDDLAQAARSIRAIYSDIYFGQLPNIHKMKFIGRIKEQERIVAADQKQDPTAWQFKLSSIKEHYSVPVVNFEGKVNTILEQIFEIVNTNYNAVKALVEENNDLQASTRLLSFAKNHLGGFNPAYFTVLALHIIEEKLPSFLDFFFSQYIPNVVGFFSVSWSSWFQGIRSSIQKYPDAHIFLNTLRLALSTPEIRTYSMKLFEAMGKFVLTLKSEQGTNLNKQKEKVRTKSGLGPKAVISVETLEQILRALDFREMTNCLCTNSTLIKIFEAVISKSRKYLEQHQIDSNNIYLVMFFIQVYGILIPNTLQVARTVVSEYELNHQYMFMTTHLLEQPFEVFYLESNITCIAFHLHILDFMNCIFPSLVYAMMQRETTDSVDRIILTYGQFLDYITEQPEIETGTPKISVFADKIMLAPVEEFDFFVKALLATKAFPRAAFFEFYPTTFTLLEVSIEELKEVKPSYDKKLQGFLQENLDPKTSVLVFLTTNITSLYSELSMVDVPSELFKFLDSRSDYLDKYCNIFENVTYLIAQSTVERSELQSDTRRALPLLINQSRDVMQFLMDSVKIDNENKEIIDRIVDNCTLFVLWGMLEPQQFELNYSKDIEAFIQNTTTLKGKIDKILKLKKISQVLFKDLECLEMHRSMHHYSIDFVENYYLKNFYQAEFK